MFFCVTYMLQYWARHMPVCGLNYLARPGRFTFVARHGRLSCLIFWPNPALPNDFSVMDPFPDVDFFPELGI